VSWGWGRAGTINPDSTFVERNEWQGTRDHAAFLAVPAAIRFQQENDWPSVRERCHALLQNARGRISELTGLPSICPDGRSWFCQLASCPIQTNDTESLKTKLLNEFNIEVPLVTWQGHTFVRVSIQAYNNHADVDALVEALHQLLPKSR
jgi:isopenicillin-N epimerase